MAIPKFTHQLREGETYRRRLRWLDSKKRPINLTGAVVAIQFRDRPDGLLLVDLTVLNGGLVITPLLGQIDIYLTAIQTAAYTFSKAHWDCKVTLSNGDVRYIAEGSVLVARSVTE